MLNEIMNRDGSAEADVRAARGLGYVSIGIGLTELVAPGTVLKLLGLEDTRERRGVLGALGVREVMHGVSLLTEREPTTQLKVGMWSRVAGDVLDSALLGAAAMKTERPLSFSIIAAAVTAIGAMDVMVAQRLQRHGSPQRKLEEQFGDRFAMDIEATGETEQSELVHG
jgi:hypothetical protein